MKALILAAGKGKRLDIFTQERPKTLLKVALQSLLDRIIDQLINIEITEIIVVINPNQDYIEKHIIEIMQDRDVHISIIVQEKSLGTGDAVLEAETIIDRDDFLLIYGDLFFGNDVLKELKKQYVNSESSCSVAITKIKNVSDYGTVEINNGNVIKIVEKKHSDEPGLINTGIYALNRQIFTELKKIELSVRGEYELTSAIELLIDNYEVNYTIVPENEWLDVGKPWSVLEANTRSLMSHDKKENVSSNFIQPVKIGKNVVIGDGCKIGPYVTIDNDVKIGKNCIINNSLIMDGVEIGENSHLFYSVVGYDTIIGNNVKTRYKSEKPVPVKLRDKTYSLESPVGAFISSRICVKDKSVFYPGQIVKI